MSNPRIELEGGNDGFLAMLRSSQQSISSFASAGSSSFAGMAASITSITGIFATLAGILAGGIAKKAIDDTVQFNKESNALARTLGITGTQASVLNIALGDIYQDSGALTAAIGKITKALADDEDKFKALGVATRDTNGQFRNSLDIMLDVSEKLGKFKEGTDRNIEGVKLFGRSWSEVAPLLKLNKELMEESRKKAEELGLAMTQEGAERVTKYRASMNDVGDVFLGIKNAIAQAVMPSLTWLGNWFSSMGPNAIQVIKIALNSLMSVFDALGTVVRGVWEIFQATLRSILDPLAALSDGMRKLLSGDFQGASGDFSNMSKYFSDAWTGAFFRIQKSALETGDAINKRFGAGTAMTGAAGSGGNGSSGGAGGKSAGVKDNNRMQAWEAALAESKLKLQELGLAEGQFREMSKAQELAYWREIMTMRGLSEKETLALRKKTTDLSLQIHKEEFGVYLESLKVQQEAAQKDFATRVLLAEEAYTAIASKYGQESKEAKNAYGEILKERRALADQSKEIETLRVEAKRNLLLSEIEAERANAQFQLDQGFITKEQLLAQEQLFEQRRFNMQMQALEQRKLLIDPTRDPVEYEKILLQIQDLELRHNLKLQEMRNAQQAETLKPFQGIFSAMENGLSNVSKALLTNWKSIGKEVVNMAKQTGMSIIQEMVLKPMQQRILAFAKERVLALAGIQMETAKAGAGAASSQAGIPIIGPILAMAAMAAIMSSVGGLASKVPSASGGFDIPRYSNPLTQLHEQEMVLPKDIANPLRANLASGGAGMGGGDTYHITTLDARSLKEFLKDNAGAFADAMRHTKQRGFA